MVGSLHALEIFKVDRSYFSALSPSKNSLDDLLIPEEPSSRVVGIYIANTLETPTPPREPPRRHAARKLRWVGVQRLKVDHFDGFFGRRLSRLSLVNF